MEVSHMSGELRDTPVLIAGGGPVGLTLAIDLGQRGIECVLVDKRPAPGMLPKMERCNARTMEHYRRLGIADQIRAAGLDNDVPMDVFICAGNVAGRALVHHPYPSVNELKEESRKANDGTYPAEPYQLISQYTLEPLLREVAEATAGVRVLFGHELTGFAQDDDGVTATLSLPDGARRIVRAQYLIGCDGGNSTVRDGLGIGLEGESLLEMRQALFRCDDLFDRIPVGKGRHYHIADDVNSFLIVQDDTRHFSLHATVSSDEEMAPLFERIAGVPVDYECLYVGKWRQRLMVAQRYRDRRVFLAGDSAHLVIPTGGLGMNTGVGDAIDLSWKLAAAMRGWGGPGLLDSYETERQAVGRRNIAASRRAASGRRTWRRLWDPAITEDSAEGERVRARLAAEADVQQRWSNDLLGIELGYRYDGSPLIVREEGEAPDPDQFSYRPSAWPGTHIPHVWLGDGVALQDRMGPWYTLVRARDDAPSLASLAGALADLGVPVRTVDVGPDLRRLLGAGALLVRPDLHVGWRANQVPADPGQVARVVSGHAGAGVSRARSGSLWVLWRRDRQRIDVPGDGFLVLRVVDRFQQPQGRVPRRTGGFQVAGDGLGPGEGLVRAGEHPAVDTGAAGVADTPAGVEERRFAVPQGCVDAGDLPLADRPVLVVAGVVPVEARRVCHVHHAVVLLWCAALFFDQVPRLVEEPGGELALVGVRVAHQVVLPT
jgi:2-polyprenyl-6-methoxyphenol hydroxylase-like FAD-dependent oxidoreductase